MGFHIWILDDEFAETVESILADEGWTFQCPQGLSRGLKVRSFSTLASMSSALEMEELDLSNSNPKVALLDAHLKGEGERSGGFAAWRRIITMEEKKSILEERRVTAIIYTRDAEITQIAEFLSTEPAKPRVLPFGEKYSADDLKNGKYQFTEVIESRLTVYREWWIGNCASKNALAKLLDLLRTILSEQTITLDSWQAVAFHELNDQYSSTVYVSDLFPQECKDLLRSIELGSGEEVVKNRVSSIIQNIQAGELDFRQAFGRFVAFLSKGTHKAVPYETHESKVHHWIVNGNPDTETAARVVNDVLTLWGPVLSQEICHLPGQGTFSKDTYWQSIVGQSTGDVNWASLREYVIKVRKELYAYDDVDASELIAIAKNTLKWQEGRLLHYMSVFPPDLTKIKNQLCADYRGCYTDPITAECFAGRVRCIERDIWFGGSNRNAISFLIRIGKPVDIRNWTEAVLSGLGKKYDPASLSATREIVCRLYGGQLLIFETSGEQDNVTIPTGTICYRSHPAVIMTDGQRGRVAEDWSDVLAPGWVYTVMSFNNASIPQTVEIFAE